jgi:hypothetical protein
MYTIQSGNTICITDRVKALENVPSGIKQFFVRAPYLFKNRPVVTVTISADQAKDPKDPKNFAPTPLIVFGMEAAVATGETLFKLSARNLEPGSNVNDKYDYWCDFTMTGELAT